MLGVKDSGLKGHGATFVNNQGTPSPNAVNLFSVRSREGGHETPASPNDDEETAEKNAPVTSVEELVTSAATADAQHQGRPALAETALSLPFSGDQERHQGAAIDQRRDAIRVVRKAI